MLYDENKFEEESVWKKKGFYLSICTGLICLLAVGAVYYKMNYPENAGQNSQVADNDALSSDAANAGQAAISGEDSSEKSQEENNATEEQAEPEDQTSTENQTSEEGKDTADIQKDTTGVETAEKEQAESKKDTKSTDSAKKKSDQQQEDDSVAVMSNTGSDGLKFNEEAGLLWPVEGDVIMKYSMNNTVYFKTLAQYRCNPAIEIAAKEGTAVSAAADGIITKITENEETGKMVEMEIGNGYTVVYGQLKNIKVKKGQKVKEGETIGVVSEPTKYFTEEGSNLYLQVSQNGKTVDPLLVLR